MSPPRPRWLRFVVVALFALSGVFYLASGHNALHILAGILSLAAAALFAADLFTERKARR
jgi:hypothetical protein